MFLWYRAVVQNPITAKVDLFASQDKATLLKEDKCISACAFSNNINVINQRKPWHMALYTVTILVALLFMWFVFALRYEECNQVLKFASSQNLEL